MGPVLHEAHFFLAPFLPIRAYRDRQFPQMGEGRVIAAKFVFALKGQNMNSPG